MRLSDTLLALLFIAVAGVMIGLTTTFPAFPGQKYGPDLFPRILGTGIIICSLLILLKDRRAPISDRLPALSLDPALRGKRQLISFLLVPGSILFYIFVADWLGFVPTAFIILSGLMLWFGVKVWRALLIAVLMTGLIHWFFGSMMRVPLARGLFMQMIYGG